MATTWDIRYYNNKSRKGQYVVVNVDGRRVTRKHKPGLTPEEHASLIISEPRLPRQQKLVSKKREAIKRRPTVKWPRHIASVELDLKAFSNQVGRNQVLKKLLPKGIKFDRVKGRPLNKHMHYSAVGYDKEGTPIVAVEDHKNLSLHQFYTTYTPVLKGLQIDRGDTPRLAQSITERAKKFKVNISNRNIRPLAEGVVSYVRVKVTFKSG